MKKPNTFANLTQSLIRYLNCPCQSFEPMEDDDPIQNAYRQARDRGVRREEASEDDMDWDEEILGEMAGGEAIDRFCGYWDYSTKKTYPLVLAEIPVSRPWEIFAWLPFGGWNECPDTPELMAVSKYWFELYGAVPAVITHDVLEYSLPAPVGDDAAVKLALEHYAWCPVVVDQGSEDGTVGTLADTLRQSTIWYFWWD